MEKYQNKIEGKPEMKCPHLLKNRKKNNNQKASII